MRTSPSFVLYLLAFAGLLISSSCVGKKKYLATVADYKYQIDSLNGLLNERNIYIHHLRMDSVFLSGSNHALLATQEKFHRRIDTLEEELDQLLSLKDSEAEDYDTRLQISQVQRKELENRLDEIGGLLTYRTQRLDQLTMAIRVAMENQDSALWLMETKKTEAVLTINEKLLFSSGSTGALISSGKPILKDVTEVLKQFPEIVVEIIGHTDNQPVNRKSIDNWEYSVLRAATIAKAMTDDYGLGTNQVLAGGKGEFAPRTSNESPEGRAENRRVELRIQFRESDLVRDLERELRKVRP